MNIFLWILQIILALHTIMGAIWKFSHSAAGVSLKAIPHSVWLLLIVIEFLCTLGLVIPAISKKTGILAPIAATVIGAEMLFYCIVQFATGEVVYSEIIYWLVVAVIGAFIAYGRYVLKPL
ncbi:MAG TPA: hypothetical protein VLS85_15055 [Hanamia sp.]|nr:hypothetical protein [Hanamia sp.]